MNNPFFDNQGPFKLPDLFDSNNSHLLSSIDLSKNEKLLYDIKNLNEATSKDISFFIQLNIKT